MAVTVIKRRLYYATEEDIEDIIQDASIKVLTAENTYTRAKGKFSTYFMFIITNIIIDRYRIGRGKIESNTTPLDDFTQEGSDGSYPLIDGILFRNGGSCLQHTGIDREVLMEEFNRFLTKNQKKLFKCMIEGNSLETISAKLKMKTGTVKATMYRIRALCELIMNEFNRKLLTETVDHTYLDKKIDLTTIPKKTQVAVKEYYEKD
jgi:RNA polymerase sigma factor (sigma-70 family)